MTDTRTCAHCGEKIPLTGHPMTDTPSRVSPSATPEMRPCPHCGRQGHLTEAVAEGDWFACDRHGWFEPSPPASRSSPAPSSANIECCTECGEPKNRTNQAGDEVADGWPYCENPSCVAFQEPVASAWFRPPSRGSEEEFGGLLEQLEKNARRLASRDAPRGEQAFKASLERVESYVSRLRKELSFTARSALLLDDQFKEVCAELASLKERQLTRYEAESVLMSLERRPFKGPEIDARYDAERRAKAKLRLLSTSDSSHT